MIINSPGVNYDTDTMRTDEEINALIDSGLNSGALRKELISTTAVNASVKATSKSVAFTIPHSELSNTVFIILEFVGTIKHVHSSSSYYSVLQVQSGSSYSNNPKWQLSLIQSKSGTKTYSDKCFQTCWRVTHSMTNDSTTENVKYEVAWGSSSSYYTSDLTHYLLAYSSDSSATITVNGTFNVYKLTM